MYVFSTVQYKLPSKISLKVIVYTKNIIIVFSNIEVYTHKTKLQMYPLEIWAAREAVGTSPR